MEQLRPHTERLLALFKEWDDDGGKITRKQFALTVQLLRQQVWLEAPAGSRTTQAPPARVLLGCFDLVDRAKVSPTLTPTQPLNSKLTPIVTLTVTVTVIVT